MSDPSRALRSVASRVRWSFLAVILAVTAIAAAVTIVLVRRANEDDTIEQARTTAEAGARAVSAQVRSQLDGDGTAAPSLLVLIELLQRSLAIQDAEIVRIDEGGLVALRTDGPEPGSRLTVTRVPTAVLACLDLLDLDAATSPAPDLSADELADLAAHQSTGVAGVDRSVPLQVGGHLAPLSARERERDVPPLQHGAGVEPWSADIGGPSGDGQV